MEAGRKLGWKLGLIGWLLLLPAAIEGQTGGRAYSIHVGPSVDPSQVQVAIGGVPVAQGATTASVGDWEVTVALDLARCRIYCAYRMKREGAAGLLLPPVTTIRVQGSLWTLDPGGLTHPSATRPVAGENRLVSVAGRSSYFAPPGGEEFTCAMAPDPRSPGGRARAVHPVQVPLRV